MKSYILQESLSSFQPPSYHNSNLFSPLLFLIYIFHENIQNRMFLIYFGGAKCAPGDPCDP